MLFVFIIEWAYFVSKLFFYPSYFQCKNYWRSDGENKFKQLKSSLLKKKRPVFSFKSFNQWLFQNIFSIVFQVLFLPNQKGCLWKGHRWVQVNCYSWPSLACRWPPPLYSCLPQLASSVQMEVIHLSLYYSQLGCLFPFNSSIISPSTVSFKGNRYVYSLSSLCVWDQKMGWPQTQYCLEQRKLSLVNWYCKRANGTLHTCSRAMASGSSSSPCTPAITSMLTIETSSAK